MLSCTGDASGRDVVLSGFFSSIRIFPHHTVDPRHRELADAALAQLKVSIWPTGQFVRCLPEKRGAC
jgi:ABC-type molybdenum transport system ATPase subunit/photorepair protein PhrA